MPDTQPATAARRRMPLTRSLGGWRDVDHRYRRFGFSIWLTGAELSLGRRFYRVRWAYRAN